MNWGRVVRTPCDLLVISSVTIKKKIYIYIYMYTYIKCLDLKSIFCSSVMLIELGHMSRG